MVSDAAEEVAVEFPSLDCRLLYFLIGFTLTPRVEEDPSV
jgi:hypothetical protein